MIASGDVRFSDVDIHDIPYFDLRHEAVASRMRRYFLLHAWMCVARYEWKVAAIRCARKTGSHVETAGSPLQRGDFTANFRVIIVRRHESILRAVGLIIVTFVRSTVHWWCIRKSSFVDHLIETWSESCRRHGIGQLPERWRKVVHNHLADTLVAHDTHCFVIKRDYGLVDKRNMAKNPTVLCERLTRWGRSNLPNRGSS